MQDRRPITPQGFQKLRDELAGLWHDERPRIVNEVSEAAAHGDRSENAEYKYGKRRLREIDRRIGHLTKLLEKLQVVDPTQNVADFVRFGATVVIEDENGQQRTYQVVGEDEVDAKAGRISMRSPIGRALLKKLPGESFVVQRPAGEIELTILEIRYE